MAENPSGGIRPPPPARYPDPAETAPGAPRCPRCPGPHRLGYPRRCGFPCRWRTPLASATGAQKKLRMGVKLNVKVQFPPGNSPTRSATEAGYPPPTRSTPSARTGPSPPYTAHNRPATTRSPPEFHKLCALPHGSSLVCPGGVTGNSSPKAAHSPRSPLLRRSPPRRTPLSSARLPQWGPPD